MHTITFYSGKTTSRAIMLLIVSLCFTALKAQKTKGPGPLQLADQYFAAGEYFTAAGLYGQYLNPSKTQKQVSDFPLNVKRKRSVSTTENASRTDIIFKQAESYRLAHYWDKAAELYKQLSDKNTEQSSNALYWYAVSKRNLGDYAGAKESLEKLNQLSANNNQYKTAAAEELKTINYIMQQVSRPDSILFTVKKLEAANSGESGVFAPARISENQFIVSSTHADAEITNDINPYRSQLYTATLNDDKLDNIAPLPIAATDATSNLGAASMSSDGKYLYFSQWKKENGQTISSIYYSEKISNGWSDPVNISSLNKAGYNTKQPFCSPDGEYIFFSSDRPGGAGKFDIWYAPLNKDGTTGTPINAGSVINSEEDEVAPFYHNSSKTLVFSSNGYGGMGGFDFFTAKGGITNWQTVKNIGNPVNSSRDDIYFYAPENEALLSDAVFSSDRGSGCCLETYTVSKLPKSNMLSGTIYDENKQPLPGAAITITDAAGKLRKTISGNDGIYIFDMAREPVSNLPLTIAKEGYNNRTTNSLIIATDESDMFKDNLTNTDIYLDKTPEVPVLVIKAEDVVTVYFEFDRSNLKPAANNKLDSIYQILTDNPQATVQISGYTDGLGSDDYNKILSDKRAKACADYLAEKGIASERITFVSFGACCPVEMELINGRDNPDGRSANRRALINVKKE